MTRNSVLVTGAGGFIGGHLVGRMKELGYGHIRAVDRKPFDSWYQQHDGVENLCLDLDYHDPCQTAAQGMQHIYNLAADMGGMGFIENNKALCMLTVLESTNMLVAARDHGCERFFFSSSACVYNGDKQTNEEGVALKEEDAYPALPEDGYGWEKLFTERMCRHFREDYGLQTRVARYHNVYGPNGTWTGGREKAPAAMCRKVIEAIEEGHGTVEIWGDGRQTRSFMFIDDCLKGTQMFLEGDCVEPLNLGSSELVTINQLLDIVEDIAGMRLERRYKLDAPKGVNGRNSDNRRILETFGWEPSIRLREGMEKTFHWIYEQYRRRAAGEVFAN